MVFEIIKSDLFSEWLDNLRDRKAKAIIDNHIYRISLGDMGKIRNVGGKVFEKKIYYGAGYRLYFVNKNEHLIFLLCGGDKSSQVRDIKLAHIIAKEVNKG